MSTTLVNYYFLLDGAKFSLFPHRFGKKLHNWITTKKIYYLSFSFGTFLLITAIVIFIYTFKVGSIRDALVGPILRYNTEIEETPFLPSQLLALFFALVWMYISIGLSLAITQYLFGIIVRNRNWFICMGVIILDILASFLVSYIAFYAALHPFYEVNWAYPNGSLIHTIAAVSGLGSLSISFFYIFLFIIAIIGHFPLISGIKRFILGTIDRIVSTSVGFLTMFVLMLTTIIGILKLIIDATN